MAISPLLAPSTFTCKKCMLFNVSNCINVLHGSLNLLSSYHQPTPKLFYICWDTLVIIWAVLCCFLYLKQLLGGFVFTYFSYAVLSSIKRSNLFHYRNKNQKFQKVIIVMNWTPQVYLPNVSLLLSPLLHPGNILGMVRLQVTPKLEFCSPLFKHV